MDVDCPTCVYVCMCVRVAEYWWLKNALNHIYVVYLIVPFYAQGWLLRIAFVFLSSSQWLQDVKALNAVQREQNVY